MGYIELQLTVLGEVFENLGFLCKDPVTESMDEQKRKVPGVIGSNIFREMKKRFCFQDGVCFNLQQEAAGDREKWANVLAFYQETRTSKADVLPVVCGLLERSLFYCRQDQSRSLRGL